MAKTPMHPDDPVVKHFPRLLPSQLAALRKLDITTIRDLLYHFPVRYVDAGKSSAIEQAADGERTTFYGQIEKTGTKKSFRGKVPMGEATLRDQTGRVKLVWFHQAYMAKMIAPGDIVRASGVVKKRGNTVTLINPEVEKVATLPGDLSPSLFGEGGISDDDRFFPVYTESRGITSRWFYHALRKMLASGIIETLVDPIPADILKRYNLPSFATALVWIHTPRDDKHAFMARKRFAFEEIFFIQLERQHGRMRYEQNPSFTIVPERTGLDRFTHNFGFPLTKAQQGALAAILADFAEKRPMLRLLEGDVGSGKTAVAAATAYAAVHTRPLGQNFGTLQVAYMCPTEILATQHFESFIKFFVGSGIEIGLITGSGCRKFPSKVNPAGWTAISRTQFLKWVENGEIPIVIGTHALIQKSVKWKHLAYVIIDEQHRFGTAQRQALTRKLNANDTQTHADRSSNTTDFLYKDLSYVIRGLLFDIKRKLGLGHKELIYQNAFTEELKNRKIHFDREKQIPIIYRNKKIGVYQPDFVIEEKIIIEFKSIPFLGKIEEKQLWTYLKGSEYRLAFLVNFGGKDIEMKRVIYDTARTNHGLRGSATSQRESATCAPHMLSMTATPIPRTLALTLYGDLDLTLLDEMPEGRKPIATEIVLPTKRTETYEKIRTLLREGRQCYVICPRIDEPNPEKEQALIAKSVKEEARRLKEKVFPEYEIGILHSKMKPAEKDRVMEQFAAGKLRILCATSVIEVGVNVPNATIIVIEGAERFGLAQLHQLRGRVLRSTHQAYCYLFSDTKGEKTFARLKALTTAKNGFELSEMDLALRGSGELGGGKQWGISDLGMEAIKNLKMVEAAREEAKRLLAEDIELKKYPLLHEQLKKRERPIHFE